MTAKFDALYRMRDGHTPLAERYFNPVFQDLDARLLALEATGKDWQAAVREVSAQGFARVNELIRPAYDRIAYYQEAGFLSARIESPVPWQAGVQTVVVSAGDTRDLFRPSPFLFITIEGNADAYLVARPDPAADPPYDPETGTLQLDVLTVEGAPAGGAHATGVWATASPGAALAIQAWVDRAEAARDEAVASRTGLDTARQAAEGAAAAAEGHADNAKVFRDQAEAFRHGLDAAHALAEQYRDEAQEAVQGVRVSPTDDTPGSLTSVIVPGDGVETSVQSPGGDEKLVFTVPSAARVRKLRMFRLLGLTDLY